MVGHFLPATTSHFLCMPVSRKYEECSLPWVIKIKWEVITMLNTAHCLQEVSLFLDRNPPPKHIHALIPSRYGFKKFRGQQTWGPAFMSSHFHFLDFVLSTLERSMTPPQWGSGNSCHILFKFVPCILILSKFFIHQQYDLIWKSY
jgi:hypothetical protein